MSPSLWPSQNDLPEAVRLPLIALLNQNLADAIDLGLQAKQAHWNIKGPQFVSLHAMFDEMAEVLEELADELAERAVELGGLAEGTLQSVAAVSRLPAYDQTLLAGMEHVRVLGLALAQLTRSTRAAIEVATAGGDATTADVFTEVTRATDKLLWKLSAHAAAHP